MAVANLRDSAMRAKLYAGLAVEFVVVTAAVSMMSLSAASFDRVVYLTLTGYGLALVGMAVVALAIVR